MAVTAVVEHGAAGWPAGQQPQANKQEVGLTPRLLEKLQKTPHAAAKALPPSYVPVLGQYVQSSMVDSQCAIMLEDNQGGHHVLRVDPLIVRSFRREFAEELCCLQERRELLKRRILNLRKVLPRNPKDVKAKLQQAIADARARAAEALVRPLPPASRVLHVLVEVSADMRQLALVAKQLEERLLDELDAAGVQYISLATFHGTGWKGVPEDIEEPINCCDLAGRDMLKRWLQSLGAANEDAGASKSRSSSHSAAAAAAGADGSLGLAAQLQRIMTAEALGPGGGAVLVVASSPPPDLGEAVGVARRSELVLQVAGVLGSSREDPEPSLQQLADAAAQGSSLHLFFGPDYWEKFAAKRERQLEKIGDEPPEGWKGSDSLSTKVLELRLIERQLRECFVEEQHCEDELVCATRLLSKTLVERMDVIAVLQEQAMAQQRPRPP